MSVVQWFQILISDCKTFCLFLL
uniref:Uncharacterized protein n=1 Tax=Arundo donax TaxID=35708 RepID=A0A0A9G343_ARUDO